MRKSLRKRENFGGPAVTSMLCLISELLLLKSPKVLRTKTCFKIHFIVFLKTFTNITYIPVILFFSLLSLSAPLLSSLQQQKNLCHLQKKFVSLNNLFNHHSKNDTKDKLIFRSKVWFGRWSFKQVIRLKQVSMSNNTRTSHFICAATKRTLKMKSKEVTKEEHNI